MGHQVRAYSFPGHKFTGPKYWRVERQLADFEGTPLQRAKLAGMKLGRVGALAHNWYFRALLCRNYFQVEFADRLYAIGFIDPKTGIVEGGTGWTVQMFLDKFQGNLPEGAKHFPAYIYDLRQHWWYAFDGLQWSACFTMPPAPEGHYAGIGTHDKFNDWGRKAIDDLYNQRPREG
jgi:hypothetical protein